MSDDALTPKLAWLVSSSGFIVPEQIVPSGTSASQLRAGSHIPTSQERRFQGGTETRKRGEKAEVARTKTAPSIRAQPIRPS